MPARLNQLPLLSTILENRGALISFAPTYLLLIDLIGLRRHDEIVLMQTADLMCPPVDVLIARNHKSLVHRPPANLVKARNHQTRLLLLAGWVYQTKSAKQDEAHNLQQLIRLGDMLRRHWVKSRICMGVAWDFEHSTDVNCYSLMRTHWQQCLVLLQMPTLDCRQFPKIFPHYLNCGITQ